MNTNSGWFWVLYAVVCVAVIGGGAVFLVRRNARLDRLERVQAERTAVAVADFQATVNALTGADPKRDEERLRFSYRLLNAKFTGTPPVESTRVYIDKLLEITTRGDRAA